MVGLLSYSRVLEPQRAWDAITSLDYGALMQIDFWAALRFTVMFTLITLPLVIGLMAKDHTLIRRPIVKSDR